MFTLLGQSTRPMSEEEITQTRQLFSSPMFSIQPNTSLLARQVPNLLSQPRSRTCSTTHALQSSSRSFSYQPLFQTTNPTFNLGKYHTKI